MVNSRKEINFNFPLISSDELKQKSSIPSLSLRLKDEPEARNIVKSIEIYQTLIIVTTTILISAGVIMIYSASMVAGMKRFSDAAFFLKRQLLFSMVGMVIMAFVSQFKVSFIRKLTIPMLTVSLLGLILCLTPMAENVKGASRWIAIGSFHFQPSELAKVAIIFYICHSTCRKAEKVKSFTAGFLPHLIVALVIAFLCMKEPDLGAGMMIMLLCFIMLFIGGTKLGYLLGGGLSLLPVLYIAIVTSPYRMRRLMSFMYPEKDALGLNYQIHESLISIGSGGLWGTGIGCGKQKLLFLPDSHTDFIAAIIGEEAGFVGLMVILFLFFILVFSAVRISMKTDELYGSYLAAGMSFFIGFQVIINMGVVMGLLPTKGMTLPLISYGGSSLICNLFAIGVILAVAKEIKKNAIGYKAKTN